MSTALSVSGLQETLKGLNELPENIIKHLQRDENGVPTEEIILNAIRQSIDDVGIRTISGRLKRSFKAVSIERTNSGIVYRISSSASYAARLNYGSPTGLGGGNRPYRYLDRANIILSQILRDHVSGALDRAITESGWL
jgi:hypothetical protein